MNVKGYNVNTIADSIASIVGKKNLTLTAQSGNASLTATAGTVNVDGTTANITSDNSLLIKGTIATLQGLSQVKVTAPLATLEGSSLVNVKGGAAIIQGTSQTSVTSPQIRIGTGSGNYVPAARQGDTVVAPAGAGTIVSGSSIVVIQ